LKIITENNRYSFFKASWIVLIITQLCDFGISKNIDSGLSLFNIQLSTIGLIIYIFSSLIFVPLTEIKKIFTEKNEKIIIALISLLLITAFISSAFSELPLFAVITTFFRYFLFWGVLIITYSSSLIYKNSVNYIFKSFIYLNILLIISCLADHYIYAFNKILIQYFGHSLFNDSYLELNGKYYLRPSGFLTESNLTALIIISANILLLLNNSVFRSKYINYAYFLISGFTFGLTGSRSALIFFISASFLIFLITKSQKKEVVIFFLVFLTGQLFTPQIHARLIQIAGGYTKNMSENFDDPFLNDEKVKSYNLYNSPGDSSKIYFHFKARRIHIWLASIEAFKTSPVIGIGSGVFFKESNKFLETVINKNKATDIRIIDKGGVNPHSIFLTILAEYGLIGMLIFISIIVWYIYSNLKLKYYYSVIIFCCIMIVSAISGYAPFYKFYLLFMIIFYIASKNNLQLPGNVHQN
jgi:O-antigen ligase